MDKAEFESQLRSDGYRVVNSSLKPNLATPNHCHDFDAKAFVLGGEITITRDNAPSPSGPGNASKSRRAACIPSMWAPKASPCCRAAAAPDR